MKMEIPESVKAVLRCGECDELLSCGPVYLLHATSKAVCGRCCHLSTEQEQLEEEDGAAAASTSKGRSRNVQYEAAAKLLSFPCRYADHGCREKVEFSEDAPNIHESSCEFRPFICPVGASGSCNWNDSWPNLKQHCDEKHPLNVLENPCNLPRPDLTCSNLQTYVISAFHFLFLFHFKVCLVSGKLFHSLRMFGNPDSLANTSYSLEIEGNDSKFAKKGSVLPPGIMMLQEPSANFILINCLLAILDGKNDDSKFTITIQSSIKFCLNCLKNIEDVSDSEFCVECRGKLIKCDFNESVCLFVDVNKKKCEKHEFYFCKYRTKCCYCEVNLVGSYIEHLSSSISCQKTTKANINSVVRVTRNDYLYSNYVLLSSINIGTILLEYYLYASFFHLSLYTSLPSYKLKNLKCSIELTDPQTKHTQMFTPQIEYNDNCDWKIDTNMDNFSSCKTIGVDVKINIEKI